MEAIHLKEVITHGAIALFGAMVHAARAHRLGKSKSFLDFLTLTVMASFSGVMFGLLGFAILPPEEAYLRLVLTGMGGYLGVEGITMLVELVRDILARRIPSAKD